MTLPTFERAVFNRNPLFGVSAQMKFHPILKIHAETPAPFQESIRGKFPGYAVVNPLALNVPAGIPEAVQAAVRANLANSLNIAFEQVHRFTSADESWAVHLTQDAITMSCKKYPRWEVFRDEFQAVLSAFIAHYNPPFATMVGLRYQNAIERSKLNLENVPWSDLLNKFIAAEFACPGLSEADILADIHRFEFREGNDKIIVQHGMATNSQTKEQVYSIDSNLNTMGKVELSDVHDRLDQLNKHSGSLFRLCITDRLYHSLEPTPI